MKTNRKFIIVAILMLVGIYGMEADVIAQRYTAWTGQTTGEFELTSDFTLTSTVRLTGDLTIHVGAGKQIKRGSFNGDMFYVQGTSTKTYKLTIKGEDNDTLYIDGGAVFRNDDARPQKEESGVWTYNFEEGSVQCTSYSGEGRVININNFGALELENVVIRNVYAGISNGSGSAVFSQNNTATRTDFKLKKCVIRTVLSGRQGSAMTLTYTNHNVLLQDFKACYCNAQAISGGGSTVRTTGPAKSVMVMDNCEIYNNCTNSYGGGIAFYMGGSADAQLTIKGNTKVHHNLATDNGGGMIGSGVIDIKSAEFYENRCTGNIAQAASTHVVGCGGGIYLYTYAGYDYYGQGIQLTMDENVSIHDNYAAWMGGGICVDLYPSDNLGFIHGNSSDATPTSAAVAENIITIDGAKIFDNTSSWGGGICVYDRLPKKHKHSLVNKVSPVLNRSLIIKGDTEISGNKSINRPSGFPSSEGVEPAYTSSYFGGGICVLKCMYNIPSGTETDYTTYGAGEINVSITGGRITNNVAYDKVNTAYNGYGGGVTAEDKFITNNYSGGCGSKLNITVGGSVVIDGNECKRDGGGLDIESAEFLLNGSTITNNKADYRGGGVFITAKTTMTVGSGDITVKNNTLNGVPNNIYLIASPSPKTIAIADESDATFNPNHIGIYTESTSTPIPVFTGTVSQLRDIYQGMVDGTLNVFDDRQQYNPINPNGGTTLYFGTSPWSPLQRNTALTDLHLNSTTGFYEIGSVKELTAFLCHVNGISPNDVDFGSGDQTANGELTADIDMEGHYWVPIGSAYTGTFDGNGHIITGLMMVPSNASSGRGLFGTTATGADIKNVTLDNCQFFAPSSGTCYVGSIVSDLSAGKVSNSVANPGTQLFASGNASAILGGLAGKVSGGTLHSSIAMTEMTGYTMGGLVGQVTSGGNLYNSFANPKFTVSGGTPNVGGLVAENTGQIENCYVRLERAQSLGSALFGMLAATNSGTNTIVKCYAPDGDASQFSHSYTYLYNNVTTGLAHCDLYKKVDAPYLYNRPNDNLVGSTGSTMTDLLNDWVDDHANSGYAPWKRSTAGGYSYTYDDGRTDITVTGGNINDDYPLLKMEGLCCAASPDGLFIEYKKSLGDMITKYNGLTDGGTIWLYGSPKGADGTDESVSVANDNDVLLYIDEDATLLQGNITLTAYTSQTLKRYSAERWHDFSSSLKESKIGISYTNNGKVDFSWASDPCGVIFSEDEDNALFPSDIPVASMDLYSFYEPEYHWINFRRNSLSHWHENAQDVQIKYLGNGIQPGSPYQSTYPEDPSDGNEPHLVPGKGYLVSVDKEQLLQNKGVLNNGDVTLYSVTKTDFNAWAERLGFNLLGNPYQSYLDFEKFINDGEGTDNGSNLWEGTNEYNRTFAVFDPELNAYRQYKKNSSYDSYGTSQYIHPHQGFFIRMTKGGADANSTTVKYTNHMRTNDANTAFRGDNHMAYPLVNFIVRDSEYNGDVAVLELDRDNDEGALKMRMGECMGRISLGYEGDDYGILFRNEVEDYQSLRFEATEAGTFTLTWNTANANFETLTLIDNIAGTETDMLARDTYCFEATPDQYPSRFKVVIGDYKGIDEPEEDGPSTGPGTFAFQMGDQLVVNGEGDLQIVDMLGRVVMTNQLIDSQSTIGLPNTAGVYLLRLTGSNGTQTQKIVIR